MSGACGWPFSRLAATGFAHLVWALNAWLSRLPQTRGSGLFRTKEILAIEDEDRRFVFQGVHMPFDSQPGEPWGDRRRSGRLVFIGRYLDEAALERGLRACLAP